MSVSTNGRIPRNELDPTAPHYADQAPLFLAEETKRVPMDEAALRGELERAYRPGE